MRHLFIVSRETPYLANYMREEFRDETGVEVFVDRRLNGERRESRQPVDVDRRSGERRRRKEIDHQLRESFHALVTIRQ